MTCQPRHLESCLVIKECKSVDTLYITRSRAPRRVKQLEYAVGHSTFGSPTRGQVEGIGFITWKSPFQSMSRRIEAREQRARCYTMHPGKDTKSHWRV